MPYYIALARNFLVTPAGVVQQSDDRTNILILGRSGVGEDSPDLTDTIILASISPINKKITMISIPRDIWIDSMKAKINTAFYYGKQKGGTLGSGITLSKSTVEEILGVPVHYAIIVDFSGFKDIVNDLGGVDVTIDRSFVDKLYPLPGHEADLCNGDKTLSCRYQTVEFMAGLAHMDGETALKFVRSRHAEGDEGTDLARSARQQKVIKGIIAKAFTPQIFLNLNKIKAIITDANKSIETDMKPSEVAIIGRFILDLRNNLNPQVIPIDLLYNPPLSMSYQNQYIFLPKKGNWSDVQAWVKNNLP